MTAGVPSYKGWFGLCPVWIRFVEDDGVEFDLRYPFTGWLFWLSDHMMRTAIFCYSAINPDWEPQWPFRITDPGYDTDDP